MQALKIAWKGAKKPIPCVFRYLGLKNSLDQTAK
jgi:hypothetical protein